MIPIEHFILEAVIGVASIGAGVFGLIFLEYKFNKPEDVKVFCATSLLGFIFWNVILSDISLYLKINFVYYLDIALSLCSGFGAAKITEKYGAKGHAIPRFLLGFFVSYLVVHWLIGEPRLRAVIYIITGLLFTPISFMTPNFIFAFLVVFSFSALITNGLILLSMIALPPNTIIFQISYAIGTVLLIIRLYYYIKVDSHQSNVIPDAERQPIVGDGNSSYNAVDNDDEETLIGTN